MRGSGHPQRRSPMAAESQSRPFTSRHPIPWQCPVLGIARPDPNDGYWIDTCLSVRFRSNFSTNISWNSKMPANHMGAQNCPAISVSHMLQKNAHYA
jgi:hypothetical protein